MRSDSETALTSLVESWSVIIENSPVGSSKSTEIIKITIQSVERMIRTMRSAMEEKWEVKFDVTQANWPRIAEQAGFLLTRFDVRGTKTAQERLKGISAKVQGLSLAEGRTFMEGKANRRSTR